MDVEFEYLPTRLRLFIIVKSHIVRVIHSLFFFLLLKQWHFIQFSYVFLVVGVPSQMVISL